MATLDDLYSQMQDTIAAIDSTKFALATQLPNLSASARQQVQSEILALSVKEGQIQGTYLNAAMATADIQATIATLKAATNSMNNAASELIAANQALDTATKVLGYVSQVIGVLAPFVAL